MSNEATQNKYYKMVGFTIGCILGGIVVFCLYSLPYYEPLIPLWFGTDIFVMTLFMTSFLLMSGFIGLGCSYLFFDKKLNNQVVNAGKDTKEELVSRCDSQSAAPESPINFEKLLKENDEFLRGNNEVLRNNEKTLGDNTEVLNNAATEHAKLQKNK